MKQGFCTRLAHVPGRRRREGLGAMEYPGALGWVESAVQRPGITRHLAAVAAWVGQGEGELPVEELKPLLRIRAPTAYRSS